MTHTHESSKLEILSSWKSTMNEWGCREREGSGWHSGFKTVLKAEYLMGDDIGSGSIWYCFSLNLRSAAQFAF